MATIRELLNKMLIAVKGRDVRQTIHDAIEKTYEDAISNGHVDMEISSARGTFESLGSRLDTVDETLDALEKKHYDIETTCAELAYKTFCQAEAQEETAITATNTDSLIKLGTIFYKSDKNNVFSLTNEGRVRCSKTGNYKISAKVSVKDFNINDGVNVQIKKKNSSGDVVVIDSQSLTMNRTDNSFNFPTIIHTINQDDDVYLTFRNGNGIRGRTSGTNSTRIFIEKLS